MRRSLKGIWENLHRVVPCGMGPTASDFHRIHLALTEKGSGELPEELERAVVRALDLITPKGAEVSHEDRRANMTAAEHAELRGIVERVFAHVDGLRA